MKMVGDRKYSQNKRSVTLQVVVEIPVGNRFALAQGDKRKIWIEF